MIKFVQWKTFRFIYIIRNLNKKLFVKLDDGIIWNYLINLFWFCINIKITFFVRYIYDKIFEVNFIIYSCLESKLCIFIIVV